MNLTSTRKMYRSDGIFSVVTRDDDNTQVFCTVEHSYLQPDGVTYLPILQPGVYTLLRGMHNLQGPKDANGNPTLIPFETFEIQGVKDAQGNTHTGILFVHYGNWETASEGCSCCGAAFAVGANPQDGMRHDEMVTSSQATFKNVFVPLQAGVNEFQLTVI